MATAESVKTKLTGLIAAANAATGSDAATLTEAVGALVAGLGAGGGTLATKTGTFTMERKAGTKIDIPHGCGKIPLIALYYLTEPSPETAPKEGNYILGSFWHRDSIATSITGSTSFFLEYAQRPYAVKRDKTDQRYDAYAFSVDATALVQTAPLAWYGGTYTWLAIYEV